MTGALGCIGAWVVKQLADRGDTPVVFDVGGDPRRIRDILDDSAFARVRFVTGDITDADAVHRAVEAAAPKAIVHLAGLQVPFCKADPALGAKVNVLGTIHCFEAALRAGVERVVYASSAAVFGPPEPGEAAPDESAGCKPTTHYGVYKRANEGSAKIYWQDNRLPSVGLRPLTVYGVGRDEGMTSGPTTAMKAAVLGRPHTIGFSGATDFHYVGDTAAAFVRCADGPPAGDDGANVYNLHGATVPVADIVATIERLHPAAKGTLTVDGPELAIPSQLDGSAIHRAYPGLPDTSLEDGIADTLRRFRDLHTRKQLDTRDLK
ncbi:MAG: NAD(P)-dependent oxidoreductase [Planctomycetes bacterium]|nr:NAD(P)-dependent oxidoreductase [Planctomycetota bacterium]